MFSIGWTELLVIGGLALIVVGPKDFPVMMRKAGNLARKSRMALEGIKAQLNDAADLAEWQRLQQQTREIAEKANPFAEDATADRVATPADDTAPPPPPPAPGTVPPSSGDR